MKNTKHAPRPWTANGIAYPIVYAADGYRVATVNASSPPDSPRHNEANARLIAAAPDLLQALQDLRKELRASRKLDVKKDFSLMVADAQAGAAIHKAIG